MLSRRLGVKKVRTAVNIKLSGGLKSSKSPGTDNIAEK